MVLEGDLTMETKTLTIRDIIHSESVRSLYQPIISLHNGEIIGYEALSRGPVGTPFASPINMIEAAETEGVIWDLEMLFRKKAIENAATLPSNKLLFLNVDPNIIKDSNYKEGFTKNYLKKFNIDPKNIVFEITERTAIDDYHTFKNITDHYKNQEYKLAIDDVGSGYSGLKSITELRPDYVKIDMDLIRNIDSNAVKQAIIRALVTMTKETGMKLIAEGVESFRELKTLIKLGVHLAQGYLLNKPSENIIGHMPEVRDLVLQLNKDILDSFSFDYAYNCVGKIAGQVKAHRPSISCKDVKNIFDSSDIDSICLVSKDNFPEGMIMKSYLNSKLADRYGYDLYSGRSIRLLMDVRPLTIDYYTPVTKALTLAMQRPKDKLYDDIIVTLCSRYYGVTTIYNIISHTMEYEKRYAKQLNPLTSLPGNTIIKQVMEQYISNNEIVGLLYIDLDHFKSYNDVYGFENGDKILKKTADLIQDEIMIHSKNNFVGHIGGDDYVAAIRGNYVQLDEICQNIINTFESNITDFFSKEDIDSGHYLSKDRFGEEQTFPLTSISIAGIYGQLSHYETPEELGNFLGKVKKIVKASKGSAYKIVDLQSGQNI